MTHPTKWLDGVTDDDVMKAAAVAQIMGRFQDELDGATWHRLATLLANHRIAGERSGVETSNKRADTLATALVKAECRVLELEREAGRLKQWNQERAGQFACTEQRLATEIAFLREALETVRGYGRADMGHQQLCDYVTETADAALARKTAAPTTDSTHQAAEDLADRW